MTTQTQEVIRLCEQLPEAARAEVADFARFLLARHDAVAPDAVVERWVSTALGAATTGMTTAEVVDLTRGEA